MFESHPGSIMSRRTKIIIAAVAGVLVLGVAAAIAGPVIYRDYIAAEPEATPTLVAEDSTLVTGGEELAVEGLSGIWNIGEGSVAGYRVDEVLNGTDVTVTGRTSQVEGSITIDGLTLSAAEFTVDVASIETDSSQRDRYFRESALRTSEHPTATFSLTVPVTATAVPVAGETIEQELTGNLTIAGVTQSVTFTAQLRTDGETTEIAGQIPISFADFGVTAPNLGFVSVEDTGFVEFSLVAQRS